MDLACLDHVTIRTRPQDVDAMRDFYRDVVGLSEGYRAAFRFPGYWMYLGGRAVVHLAGTLAAEGDAVTSGVPASGSNGRFDHVSFQVRGIADARAHLQEHGIAFAETPVPGMPVQQLVFHDPAGLKVELTFYGEE